MNKEITRIQQWLRAFIAGLILSGATAIPIKPELECLIQFVTPQSFLYNWLNKVMSAYANVKNQYPFLLYGYDWLTFAHFILAILFIGPYRDPVKNIWVIQFGMIACILVFPLAFIAGHFRRIPFGWQLIDCSFGVVGYVLLWICYKHSKKLEEIHAYE